MRISTLVTALVTRSSAFAAAGPWGNIGVRIEDDILVTEKGPECLSCAAPREIADVEQAMAVR